MTAPTLTSPAPTTPFTLALAEIDELLATDPTAARARFTAALAVASETERELLDQAVDRFTRSPYDVAARQLGWMAKSRPEFRALIAHLITDTDPGLYHPDQGAPTEVGIEVAEWVSRQIRRRRASERTHAVPSPTTDAARLAPAAVAKRRARRGITGPVDLRHRDRDRRTREHRRRGDDEFAAYAATRLYAIDDHTEPHGDPVIADPGKPGHFVWTHVQAALWDRSYFLHVAQDYCDRTRDLLTPPEYADRTAADAATGRDATLDAAANTFLGEHATDPAPPRRRTSWRNNTVWAKVSTGDQRRFAAARTRLRVPDDYDELLPYTQLDEPEATWEGSGLDYDRAVLVSYLGWPCVVCWIDRSATDRRPVHVRDGRCVSDDGLCDVCRADGHPGIPPLPAQWTTQQFIESRCAHIAATYPRQARALLDRIRAASANSGSPAWRIITRWMDAHLERPEPAPRTANRPSTRRRRTTLGAGQRVTRCDACAQTTVVHADGYCTDCRTALGLVVHRVRPSAA
ncbi:hypothetical protein IU438_27290 [Nocardia cyriacigeorgica]|uniref:hypothetical protein n=1 Tax=Nocardia cyriacigeorgica TaxID=135487 RepID=UPI001893A8D8|nr:hypothetical protein [Nocardia cyriacigeorgica]MBF6399480.1 hypothetical protein [Nocardia cyriacigeorgica]MBF6405110.1 hypothetical protein [Nocardia cyriacigeorgica]